MRYGISPVIEGIQSSPPLPISAVQSVGLAPNFYVNSAEIRSNISGGGISSVKFPIAKKLLLDDSLNQCR
jgi:hypothetical protein